MTELEQARVHLRKCQLDLAVRRRSGRDRFNIPAAVVIAAGHNPCRQEIDDVLAALSWVWDAQERANVNLVADAYFQSLRDSGYDPAVIEIVRNGVTFKVVPPAEFIESLGLDQRAEYKFAEER